MSEFLYHLKVGETFLAETQNPEAIKKKEKIQLYRTFKWQAKQNKTKTHHNKVKRQMANWKKKLQFKCKRAISKIKKTNKHSCIQRKMGKTQSTIEKMCKTYKRQS